MTAAATPRIQAGHPLIKAVVWPVALLTFAYRVLQLMSRSGGDLRPVWEATRAFLSHGQPYVNHLFIYPPGALILLSPLGIAGFSVTRVAFAALSVAAVLVGAALVLRSLGQGWRSPASALTLLGLALFQPLLDTLGLGQVNALVFLAEAVVIQAWAEARWRTGALVLGLSLAFKPVLALLVLVPVLRRRWDCLALALAVPVGLGGAALLLLPDAGLFFSHTVPLLLHGDREAVHPFNVALTGPGEFLGIPHLVTDATRLLVGALCGLGAWWAWRRDVAEPLRLIETSGLLVLGTLLCASFSWPHYAVLLLPLLISVVHPQSLMRTWAAWVAAYLVGTSDVWATAREGRTLQLLGHYRPTWGYLLLLLVLVLALARIPRGGGAGPQLRLRPGG